MSVKDPYGKEAHTPGAKLDADKLQPLLVYEGFAGALELVTAVATMGAKKYTPDGWLLVPEGQRRYTNAMLRHLNAELQGCQRDDESGLPHAAHTAWNALARLELLLIEMEDNQ